MSKEPEKKEYTRKNTIVLFDVDGTLTKSRLKVTPEMLEMLVELRKKITIGFVGGSDLKKQQEQLGDNCLTLFDYCFPQNGVKAYKNGVVISTSSFLDKLGNDNVKKLNSWLLAWLSKVDVPKKRGCFIEFRECMMNVSPVGRNCSQAEREEFWKFDSEAKVREKLCADLKKEFADLNLSYVIGGQISIDIFPKGWDKTYCLQFVEKDGFDNVFFFGDKTMSGGNDHEIYASPKTVGFTVKTPDDTMGILKKMFF